MKTSDAFTSATGSAFRHGVAVDCLAPAPGEGDHQEQDGMGHLVVRAGAGKD